MAIRSFTTLAQSCSHSIEIKRSVFRATAVRADSAQKALETIEKLSDPDATHNCWAYRIEAEYRFSDDGEPGGTAGRPIYTVLEGRDLDHVLILVTRYFGGIKLGAGGLARAYSGAAAECLDRARTEVVKPLVRLALSVPFQRADSVYRILEEMKIGREAEEFTPSGPRLEIEIDAAREQDLRRRLQDATSGGCSIDSLDDSSRG